MRIDPHKRTAICFPTYHSMSQQKTEFTRYPKLPDGRTIEINKTYLCDMAKANACQTRARWYGFERIGPRIYALYKCPVHGLLKIRV